MSIIAFPNGGALPPLMNCAICSCTITPDTAMFGPSKANGSMSVICNNHFYNSMRFISLMADYHVEERFEYYPDETSPAMRVRLKQNA